jgi:hypothetical protein
MDKIIRLTIKKSLKINRIKKGSRRVYICLADVYILQVTYRYLCELL